MILTRPGSKKRSLNSLVSHFPANVDVFIDLFAGSGSVTCAMAPRVKYVISNDMDAEIFHLWRIIQERKDDFIRIFRQVPISADQFKYWRSHKEQEPVLRAVRYLYLCNFSFMGCGETLVLGARNHKEPVLNIIDMVFNRLGNVQWLNHDFREVLSKVSVFSENIVFVYADPPFLGVANKYEFAWSLKNLEDLVKLLINSGYLFAISEFDSSIVREMAERYNLNLIHLGERRNLKNRRSEIMITNYQNQPGLFDKEDLSEGS